MSKSKIEWTDATWNPVTGCDKVSSGCKNCFAERMAYRLQAMGTPGYANGFQVTCHPERLEQPLRWRKSRMIFVCSMGDLFHEDVPDEFIRNVFMVMDMCPQHTFQVLTKRADRLAAICNAPPWFAKMVKSADGRKEHACSRRILPNVWLGTSIEDQATANERIPHLLKCPAANRFLSVEPMLGSVKVPVSQRDESWPDDPNDEALAFSENYPLPVCSSVKMAKVIGGKYGAWYGPLLLTEGLIHWVICGCETGPGRRPCDIDWIRNLKDQCVASRVPFFLKQMEVNGKIVKMPELDGKAWDQMPKVCNEHMTQCAKVGTTLEGERDE